MSERHRIPARDPCCLELHILKVSCHLKFTHAISTFDEFGGLEKTQKNFYFIFKLNWFWVSGIFLNFLSDLQNKQMIDLDRIYQLTQIVSITTLLLLYFWRKNAEKHKYYWFVLYCTGGPRYLVFAVLIIRGSENMGKPRISRA